MAQAQAYAMALHRDRAELYPYFERLARALAKVYGAPADVQELRLDPEHVPEARVFFHEGAASRCHPSQAAHHTRRTPEG